MVNSKSPAARYIVCKQLRLLDLEVELAGHLGVELDGDLVGCLLYTSDAAEDLAVLTHSLLHHELADGLERGGDGLGASLLGLLGGNLGGGVGSDLGEDVAGGLLRDAEGLEVVAEVTQGHVDDVAGAAAVGHVLDENDGGLLGNLLVGLHVETGDAAGGAGGDSLGGADALYRGSGRGSVSSIDGRKMLRSKTLKP